MDLVLAFDVCSGRPVDGAQNRKNRRQAAQIVMDCIKRCALALPPPVRDDAVQETAIKVIQGRMTLKEHTDKGVMRLLARVLKNWRPLLNTKCVS